jgi:hypothetical protein
LVVLAIGHPIGDQRVEPWARSHRAPADDQRIASGVDSSLWATFIAMLGALVAAGIGGMIGGASQRRRAPRRGPRPAMNTQTVADDARREPEIGRVR